MITRTVLIQIHDSGASCIGDMSSVHRHDREVGYWMIDIRKASLVVSCARLGVIVWGIMIGGFSMPTSGEGRVGKCGMADSRQPASLVVFEHRLLLHCLRHEIPQRRPAVGGRRLIRV